MKLYELLFESKQQIFNLGYPRIITSLLFEKFGNKAFLIAKWFKDYNQNYFDENDKDWWKKVSRHFYSMRHKITDLIDLYEAASKSEEEYNKVRVEVGLGRTEEDFNQEKVLIFLKREIEDDFFENYSFFQTNLIKDILSRKITDFKPYDNLSFSEASEKYETKKIFQDKQPIKTYSDGWKWIDVGSKCQIVGNKMRNCGSAGVTSTDPDRTILTLFDSNNEPHVVATYSPNEQRISGVEGGASTAIKREYISYVLDLVNTLGVNLDIRHEKSKELKIRYLLGQKIKSLRDISENIYQEIFEIKTNDNKVFYTNSYRVISKEDLKSIKKSKLIKTTADKIIQALSWNNSPIEEKVLSIEDFANSLTEGFLKTYIKQIILKELFIR